MKLNNNNKQQGDQSERAAIAALRGIGVRLIEPVYTPWHITRIKGKVVAAKPMRKVSGDIRGITETGRSVLCEVKWRPKKLTYSDLEAHQHQYLTVHKNYGGLSLVAWHNEKGLYVFLHGIEQFQPGKSLTPEQAAGLCIAAFVSGG